MVEPSGDYGQDEAVCFFLNNFSWQCSSSNFTDWQSHSSVASKAVVTAVSAVGYGNLSSVRESTALRRKARDAYAIALQLVNKSLSDNEVAVSDMTLAAIILLSLFEVRLYSVYCGYFQKLTFSKTITYKDLKYKNRWLTHVEGCTSLQALRGVERLLTEAGTKMFFEWRGQLVRATPDPSSLQR